jgi:hypothetical protein
MADSVYEIAYEEAVRAFSEQRASVESLRARALTLFAIAISSNSFLGGIVIRDSKPGGVAWVALGLLVVLGVIALLVLQPRVFVFTISPRALVEGYGETDPPADIANTYRQLSLHIERTYEVNQRRSMGMSTLIQAGAFLLICQTILWLVALILK